MKLAAGVVLGVAAGLVLVPAGAAAQSSTQVIWQPPALVDHLTPFGQPFGVRGISCPSSTFCAASDDTGAAIEPDGGVLVSSDPGGAWSTWHRTGVNGITGGLAGLSCSSSMLCVAYDRAGDVASSTDPGAANASWKVAHIDSAASQAANPGVLSGISCPSSALCVAVDYAGNVLASNTPGSGDGWTSSKLDSTVLSSVSCPTVTFCAAVDEAGNVLVSNNPAGGAAAWSRYSIDPGSALATISCASASFCAATDIDGQVLTSSAPSTGATSWSAAKIDGTEYQCGGRPDSPPCRASLETISCPSSSLCVGSDQLGQVFSSQDPSGGPSAWHQAWVSRLAGVSCPDTSSCVGVGGGDEFFSNNPTGAANAWSSQQIDGENSLSSTSCTSSAACVGVDSSGHAVTWTPAGASAATIDPSTTPSFPMGVSCPSASLCVAVDISGHVLTSSDPAAGASSWSLTNLGVPVVRGTLGSVSCPSNSFCAAVDQWGYIVTTTDPTGGASAWHERRVEGCPGCIAPNLRDITCPTRSFCSAIDGNGNVIWSRNPAGATAWHQRHIAATNALQGLSCPSIHLCVAVARTGTIFTSTNPAATHPRWSQTRLGAPWFLHAVSCRSAALCTAIASAPNSVFAPRTVLVSTNPTGGRSAWSPSTAPMPLGSITCFSVGTCFAAGAESVALMTIAAPRLRAQIVALLRHQLKRLASATTAGSLLHRAVYRTTIRSLTAGSLRVRYVSTRAPRTFASTLVRFDLAGRRRLVLRLTRAGRAHAATAGSDRLRVIATFRPLTGRAVVLRRALKTPS